MLLEAKGIKKSFGGLMAIDDVDFSLNEGHIESPLKQNGFILCKVPLQDGGASMSHYPRLTWMEPMRSSCKAARDQSKEIAPILIIPVTGL